MATFILIHGAWHGGWCWERVVPLLRATGHQAIAPDLPGMGADSRPFGNDPLALWADFVADLARTATERPVILVGHSRGGIVISEAAERAPDHIDRLVYLTAFLLQPGQSLADVAGRDPDTGPGSAVRPAEDPACVVIDADAGRPIFYGQCSDEDAQAAARRLTPEPLASLTRPVHTTPERFGRVPRAYIEATEDRAISLALQREMQAALPCDPVITLPSDHSPFYSAAPELARALLSLV